MKGTRDYRIEIRLNKNEYDILCRKIGNAGLNISSYIRRLILGQRILSIPLDNDYFIKMYETQQICINRLTNWKWENQNNNRVNTEEIQFLFREVYNKLIEIHDKYSYNEWKNKSEADRILDNYSYYLSKYNKMEEEKNE